MAKKESKNENKIKKHFFKDFKAELKKVIWPTPKQLVNNTVAVVTIVLITAVIVFGLDFVFKAMNDYGIDKLKTHLQNNQQQTQVVENTNTEQPADTNSEQQNAETGAENGSETTTTDAETNNTEATNNEGANTEAQDNNSVEKTAE